MIADAQKNGKTCAWIDAEASYDSEWAGKLGVDSEKLIYSPAKSINDMVDIAIQLMDAGVDIIIVDSISALLPAIYFEKDSTDLKKLEDTKQIGAEAKDMTHAVKMLNYANKIHYWFLFLNKEINLDLCMLLTYQLEVWQLSFFLLPLLNFGLQKQRQMLLNLV
jgi:recombination protein RecA